MGLQGLSGGGSDADGEGSQALRVALRRGRIAGAGSERKLMRKAWAAAKRAGFGARVGGRAKKSVLGRAAGRAQVPGRYAQRVIVKARFTSGRGAKGAATLRRHLDYIQRDGAGVGETPARAFDSAGLADRERVDAFAERCADDRHTFRMIVSPEAAGELGLERYTRELMGRMEGDLGTRLDWVAAAHYDTDNPHIHVVIRGVDDRGGDLVMSKDYISRGIRARGQEIATRELGHRTELDVAKSLARDLGIAKFTELDRRLIAQSGRDPDGLVRPGPEPDNAVQKMRRALMLGRLSTLRDMGLSERLPGGVWRLSPDLEKTLRGTEQESAIARVLKPVLEQEHAREFVQVSKDELPAPVHGVVVARGIANELTGSEYLAVAGTDGKVHYVGLSAHAERHMDAPARVGELVVLSRYTPPPATAADRTLVAQAGRNEGIYDPQRHLQAANARVIEDPEAYVAGHQRRAEALVARGHVERLEGGRYRVPADLEARLERELAAGRDRASFVRVTAPSRGDFREHRVMAFTALDREIVRGTLDVLQQEQNPTTTQRALRAALEARVEILDKIGLIQRQPGGGTRLTPDAPAKLADRELREAGAALDRRYGQYASLDATREEKGLLVEVKDLPSGRFAVIAHPDGGVTLAPAPRNAEALIGKPVHVELAADRHMAERVHTPMQTLVRTKVITERDLSRDRGLGL